LDHRESKDPLVSQDQLDQLVLRVSLESQVLLDHREFKVVLELQDQLDHRVSRDLLESLDHRVIKDLLVLQVLLE
jgi:hypothetical protein